MECTHTILTSLIIGCSLLPAPSNGRAEMVTINVTDQSGEPVADSVISAYPQTHRDRPPIASNETAIIDQIDKEFIAHVTPIQAGTSIAFPNHDQIRHHVYSFSPARTFEIPLYKGMPAKPIAFGQSGIVTLGCNIHDWMSAYIYVVDTAFFSLTDNNGQASLELPPGEYEIRYWHPDIDIEIGQTITVTSDVAGDISAEIRLNETWSLRRGPLSLNSRGTYR